MSLYCLSIFQLSTEFRDKAVERFSEERITLKLDIVFEELPWWWYLKQR